VSGCANARYPRARTPLYLRRRIDSARMIVYASRVHKLPVGVLGASGYAGRELCALIARHPGVELAFAAANERRGERARIAGGEITFIAPDDAPLDRAALVFSALPHGASASWVAQARRAGAKVVDLSADLRPGNGAAGEPVPYGLTELARDAVRGAQVVANPGCYPTAVLLALLPLIRRGLVLPEGTITVSAASGVTGAGFTPRHDLLFAEVAEDFRPYAVGNTHRHLAEMRAVMQELGCGADLIFTPHLLPVARGILATITVPLAAPLDDPLTPWREDYAGEPFVEVTDQTPALRDVVRRNVARITAMPAAGVRAPTLIVVAAIDNLVKGAAGQALQNGNLLLGLEETLGLPA
jgi:N-acetyl-gamma-glutamyl-phosphate reductase